MKQKTIYKIMLFLLLVIATWSCERDDICADTTDTTPHLIIRFYDINNPENRKQVRQLSIRGFDADGNEIEQDFFATANTDSIVLPLRFQTENASTSSKFILEKDRDFFLDENPATNSNIDIISVNYIPEFVYVSRACGYKSIFTNVSITINPDSNNWIFSSEIVNSTIENETQAQIILRH
ncbi:MAG: DUF6452 family protein [Aquaticitalea sp.]